MGFTHASDALPKKLVHTLRSAALTKGTHYQTHKHHHPQQHHHGDHQHDDHSLVFEPSDCDDRPEPASVESSAATSQDNSASASDGTWEPDTLTETELSLAHHNPRASHQTRPHPGHSSVPACWCWCQLPVRLLVCHIFPRLPWSTLRQLSLVCPNLALEVQKLAHVALAFAPTKDCVTQFNALLVHGITTRAALCHALNFHVTRHAGYRALCGASDTQGVESVLQDLLSLAIRLRHTALVKYLLEQHACLRVKNPQPGKRSPMMLACATGHLPVVEALIQHQKFILRDFRAMDMEALVTAVAHNRRAVVTALLKRYNFNLRDARARNNVLLKVCARNGWQQMLELLLEKFAYTAADVQRDDYEAPCLAYEHGHTTVFWFLVDRFGLAKPELLEARHFSVLRWAVDRQDGAMLGALGRKLGSAQATACLRRMWRATGASLRPATTEVATEPAMAVPKERLRARPRPAA